MVSCLILTSGLLVVYIYYSMLGFFNKIIDWIKGQFFNKELEMAIVGLQNAGKTTLVKSITDGIYDEDTIPTIGFNHHEIKKGTPSLRQARSP